MTKDIITLLTEEISLHKSVSEVNLAHTEALVMDARKSSSQYQKEAEKCNTGMETCAEAGEKAGAALSEGVSSKHCGTIERVKMDVWIEDDIESS